MLYFALAPLEVKTTTEENELNEEERIKQMLRSRTDDNDPRKIKDMMLKLKEAKTAGTVWKLFPIIQITEEAYFCIFCEYYADTIKICRKCFFI